MPTKSSKVYVPRDTKGFIFISADLPIEEHCRILCGGVDLTGTVIDTKDESKELESTLAKKDANPYIQARAEVLSKMNKACRNQILEMEATKDTENRIYKHFIDSVAELGDTLGNKK